MAVSKGSKFIFSLEGNVSIKNAVLFQPKNFNKKQITQQLG